MRAGKPLRFLLLTFAGWAGVRAVLLWPAPDLFAPAAMAVSHTPPVVHPARRISVEQVMDLARSEPAVPPLMKGATRPLRPRPSSVIAYGGSPIAIPTPLKTAGPSAAQVIVGSGPAPGALPKPLPIYSAPPPSRWSTSLWLIARGSGTGAGLNAAQLGASQAGARVTYALGAERRFALVGRLATPLSGGGREAAVGVEWRPAGAGLRVFAEQRLPLDGGRGGPSAGVIGGLDRAIGEGFQLEGYGQAGAIARRGVEGFADGAARISHPVAALGPARLDLGLGAWGAAQRGAGRLDVGPSAGLVLPLAGRNLRVTLDWRERVAGNARPASGPALSLGTDF